MARVDEDGYFQIIARKREMILAGAYQVYPRDIEEVLYENPKVKEVAVVGNPARALAFPAGESLRRSAGRGNVPARRSSSPCAGAGWPSTPCPGTSSSARNSPGVSWGRCCAACWSKRDLSDQRRNLTGGTRTRLSRRIPGCDARQGEQRRGAWRADLTTGCKWGRYQALPRVPVRQHNRPPALGRGLPSLGTRRIITA